MNTSDINSDLIAGRWERVRAERIYDDDGAFMEFNSDGGLVYGFRVAGKVQFSLLVYRIDGSNLLTNQPSAPREDRTPFSFEGRDSLLLGPTGDRTWWQRISSEAGA